MFAFVMAADAFASGQGPALFPVTMASSHFCSARILLRLNAAPARPIPRLHLNGSAWATVASAKVASNTPAISAGLNGRHGTVEFSPSRSDGVWGQGVMEILLRALFSA